MTEPASNHDWSIGRRLSERRREWYTASEKGTRTVLVMRAMLSLALRELATCGGGREVRREHGAKRSRGGCGKRGGRASVLVSSPSHSVVVFTIVLMPT
eukprot:2382495-Prymnesium_polylepis.1